MKVLVTGGTGFLGTVFFERLLAHGETDVRMLVRPSTSRAKIEAIAAKFPQAKIEYFAGSLSSRADCEKMVEGVDVIYHLAAALGGAPADMFLNTVVASKNLLEGVAKLAKKPKIVLVSSFGVYGVAELPRKAVVDELTPLESHPERRDIYSQAKLRQEKLFWDYQEKLGFDLVVLRPGVIYGPRGGQFSARIGLKLFGVFLHLGDENVLPLSYVENCAEAIVVAGQNPICVGQVYNVHDDELPTCGEYLRAYQDAVTKVRTLKVPYPALLAVSKAVEEYHKWSKGQLPAVFTPYKTKSSWGGNRFDNTKLKAIGWKQLVPTREAMRRTFEYFKGL